MNPSLVFRYPWLILGPGLLVLLLVRAHPRAQARIATHHLSQREWRSFVRGLVACVLTYSMLVTAIQIAGGHDDFFCLLAFFPPRSLAGLAFWLVQAGWITAFLGWLWLGSGGHVLARVGPVFTRHTSSDTVFNRRTVRVVITVFLLAGNVGAAVVALWQPSGSGIAIECGF